MNDFKFDPRDTACDAIRLGDEQPVVGDTARGRSPFAIFGLLAVSAVALFLFLNARRAERLESMLKPSANQTATAGPPPPLNVATPSAFVQPPPPPPASVVVAPSAPPPPDDTIQRLRAPTVVVDLQARRGSDVSASPAPNGAPGTAGGSSGKLASGETGDAVSPMAAVGGSALVGAAAAAGAPLLTAASSSGALSPSEQFAARASNIPPDPVFATQMANLGTTITQGATIPAIMETAISSDLPGYTRAVVSRDVRSFDGKNVLIPRGSRLIGQYRNAISLGQSRVFIIWSRVIRPDGVTVQIGSPGADALGRAGLEGDVNSHFFARFGGAILLSVLNGGIAAIAGTPSTQISIGSPAAAAGAASAAFPTGSDIQPTIDVDQGAAINIFVARDLDFSGVKPVL